ncbi:hypothetical protein BC829DRAFT_285435 [Chytridium lagenaria]|nr:hypothetical protein BC829DRAFT_285435 [Chytridium lagenaria]
MSVLDVRRIILVGGSTGKAAVGGVWIYNAVLDEWSQDVKMSLPYPLQGLTMSVLVQTEYKDACTYGAGFAICTPMNDTVAVVFGGLNPTLGTINDIRVAFIEPEKHPRPLRFPPISILSVGHASAGAGILISLAALVSTAIYRRTAAFRSASPLFLSTYALGAIGAFIGIVLYNLASREFRLCGTALWMFSEGCLMLVAAMVVKNWRTYYIYLRPASLDPNPTSLNDFVLFSVLFIILLINSAAILTFQRLSPYEVHLHPVHLF